MDLALCVKFLQLVCWRFEWILTKFHPAFDVERDRKQENVTDLMWKISETISGGSGKARPSADSRLRIFNVTRQIAIADFAESASQSANRRKGLLGRDGLMPGEGLWISPCEAVHTIGMRFPIDLVYIGRDMQVKKVKSAVPPWRISACLVAHSVIELPAGTVKRTQTARGDRLEFSDASFGGEQQSLDDHPESAGEAVAEVASPAKKISLRPLFEFLVVGICTLMFSLTALGILSSLLGKNAAGTRDFVEYWASAKQLVHRADPYNVIALTEIERSAGFPKEVPTIVMANPPSTLLLIYPLGFLGATAAQWVWLLLLLLSLVVSVRIIWNLHGRPKNLVHVFAYSFVPVLSCILSGQITLFILLGLALFLKFHQSKPFLAGASLWLCMLKPHLFVPFGVVLILWAFRTRSYRVLTGVTASLIASTLAAMAINPNIWGQYMQMMKTARVDRLPIPCVSVIVRRFVPPHTGWIQCLPVGLGCVWAVWYFLKHRENWNWVERGSPLMLVSVLVAPYTWFMDQAILIPAVLHGVYVNRSRTLFCVLALASAVVEIGIFNEDFSLLQSPFYIWTAPFWLLWYLLATRTAQGTKAA